MHLFLAGYALGIVTAVLYHLYARSIWQKETSKLKDTVGYLLSEKSKASAR